MSYEAEVIAFGVMSPAVRDSLQYPGDHYEAGSYPVVSVTCTTSSRSDSEFLAQIMGVTLGDFSTYKIDNSKIHWERLKVLFHWDIESVVDLEILTKNNFILMFNPNY